MNAVAEALRNLLDEGELDWRTRAACRATSVRTYDTFFPRKGKSAQPAKQRCAQCPVVTECLMYALTNKEAYGVWGKTSEKERRKMLDKIEDGVPVWALLPSVSFGCGGRHRPDCRCRAAGEALLRRRARGWAA